jgi:hypothetical protein
MKIRKGEKELLDSVERGELDIKYFAKIRNGTT